MKFFPHLQSLLTTLLMCENNATVSALRHHTCWGWCFPAVHIILTGMVKASYWFE